MSGKYLLSSYWYSVRLGFGYDRISVIRYSAERALTFLQCLRISRKYDSFACARFSGDISGFTIANQVVLQVRYSGVALRRHARIITAYNKNSGHPLFTFAPSSVIQFIPDCYRILLEIYASIRETITRNERICRICTCVGYCFFYFVSSINSL